MKRYDIHQEEERWASMEPDPEGDWVSYNDVLTLLDDLLKARNAYKEGNYSDPGFINDVVSALEDLT